MKISLLTPTRHRPKSMRRLWESALDTAKASNNIEVVFCVDEDDKQSIDAYMTFTETDQLKCVISNDRIVLSNLWNMAYDYATGDICMHCGDDIIFRTNDWDEIIINEFMKVDDRILFVYGSDGIWDSKELGTHGFLHRNWINTIGYFVPPYFSYGRNDTWLTEVATKIDRLRYIPEIYTEHMHFARNKSEKDAIYIEAAQRGKRDNVLKIWTDTKNERIDNAKKLWKFIEDYKK